MRGCDTHRAKRTILYRRARTACGVRMNALASSQAPHHSSPCKHADSFALLLVLSKSKHRFGFGRRNGGAAVELSGLHGKRNGASPFGRYPLLHSSFLASRPLCWVVMRGTPPAGGEAIQSPDHLFPVVRTFAFRLKFQWSAVGCPGRENRKSPCSPDRLSFP